MANLFRKLCQENCRILLKSDMIKWKKKNLMDGVMIREGRCGSLDLRPTFGLEMLTQHLSATPQIQLCFPRIVLQLLMDPLWFAAKDALTLRNCALWWEIKGNLFLTRVQDTKVSTVRVWMHAKKQARWQLIEDFPLYNACKNSVRLQLFDGSYHFNLCFFYYTYNTQTHKTPLWFPKKPFGLWIQNNYENRNVSSSVIKATYWINHDMIESWLLAQTIYPAKKTFISKRELVLFLWSF